MSIRVEKKSSLIKIVLAAVLVLQIFCMIYYANQKQGYFVDELWSYGLSNSYYHPHVYSDDALEQKWVSGEYFRNYLEVLPNQRFQYGSVIYNQTQDFHPPLFYMVLHTVCSLFPRTFSKWYGIIPNIAYFAVIDICLFYLAKKLFQKEWLALIPVVIYGFSAGAISNVIYIRMYVLLTMFTLLLLNLHLRWIINEKIEKREFLMLLVIPYMGYMSHYYFFVLAFFTAAFYCLYLIAGKKVTEMIKYGSTMFLGLFLVLFTFPTAYKKLFFDQRGSEAVQNLFHISSFLKGMERYWDIMGEGCFGKLQNILVWMIIWCGFCMCVNCLWKKCANNTSMSIREILNRMDTKNKKEFVSILFLIFVMVSYFMIVVKIAPYQVDRYIFAIYPIAILVVLFLFWMVLRYWTSDQSAWKVILGLTVILVLSGVSGKNVQYLYRDHKNNVKIMEQNSGADCLYVTWDYYKLVGNALELEHMGRVFTEVPDRIEELSHILDPNKDKLIVYVDESFDQNDILEKICSAGGFHEWKQLFESRCIAYELIR